MSVAAVDGTSELLLVRDYLEKAGLVETVRALETEAGIQPPLPGLAAVRSLALDGKWREIEKALTLQPGKELGREGGELLQRARFSLVKQEYLEAVAGLDAICSHREPSVAEVAQVQRHFERLEHLAPSREDISALEAVSSSETEFFSSWNLQKARKETCDVLLQWARRSHHSGARDNRPFEKSGRQVHSMSLLLAKGKIHEQCEQVLRERCHRRETTLTSGKGAAAKSLLDISSWLQCQPDHFFQQELPSPIEVVVTLPSMPHPSSPEPSNGEAAVSTAATAQPAVVNGLSPVSVQTEKPSSSSDQQRGAQAEGAESTKELELNVERKDIERAAVGQPAPVSVPHKSPGADVSVEAGSGRESEDTDGERTKSYPTRAVSASPMYRSTEERVTEHREQVEMATNRLRESLKKTFVEDPLIKEPNAASIATTPQRKQLNSKEVAQIEQQASPESQHRAAASWAHPQLLASQDPPQPASVPNSLPLGISHDVTAPPTPPAWLLQTTPLVHCSVQKGRNSSTPKPSVHLFPSPPPSSPVPHIPEDTTSARNQLMQGVGKQIDFDQEAVDSQRAEDSASLSASWPTASLAGRATDTQAVRSVAFSQSGRLVAVGTNSKCLRLFSTAPLLDSSARGEEMVVLDEHPRYHRGSIYCLAWLGDALLVSGSNDKTIKLLSCHSNSGRELHCSPQGRLSFHEGTVRELAFLSNGQLASAGSGYPSLLISDCEAMKLVSVFSGHAKQVLCVARGGRGSTLVSGGEDETVRLWDYASRKCVYTLEVGEAVTSLSTHTHHLAAALSDGSCCVYDVRNWQQVSSFQPHSSDCRSIRHSPSGKQLLTGSYDGSVCLAEAVGTEWVEVAQHGDKVVQARWHPHRQLFASTSTDKTTCFWTLH